MDLLWAFIAIVIMLYISLRFFRGSIKHSAVLNAFLAKYTYDLMLTQQSQIIAKTLQIMERGGRGTDRELLRDYFLEMPEMLQFSFFALAMAELGIPPALPNEKWHYVKNPYMSLQKSEHQVQVVKHHLKNTHGVEIDLQYFDHLKAPDHKNNNIVRAESLGKKEYICPILNARFVLIPAGTFMMGSPENEPERKDNEVLHKVTISKPFYLQTTQVTQGQWKNIMGNNPSHCEGDKNLPIDGVSWNDIQEFIQKLNKKEGADKYRLPTEAQWEYACRAGTTTAYCFGDDPSLLGEYAWINDYKRHPVGQKKPNKWGLYDMHGSWELVQDEGADYPTRHITDPEGPSLGFRHVIRGGSMLYGARSCRSANRGSLEPDKSLFGFRLLREAVNSEFNKHK